MKVLQLCNKPPFPPNDGGCIAMKNIAEGLLSEGVELKIITVSTEKHPFEKSNYPKEFLEKTKIESVFIDTRINLVDAFSALVTSDSYNVSRFFSTDFDAKLRNLLQRNKYDIVHLESLFMTPYIDTIRKYSHAKIVLRSHNLEHIIWQRLANTEGNKAKKLYLKHLAKKLKKYEKNVINNIDGVATISFEDSKRFKKLECEKPIVTIPFGVDIDHYIYSPNYNKETIDICHLGSMDWNPNLEAVNWFLDEIYPNINIKNIHFHLAGKSMPNYFFNYKDDGLTIDGEVEDAISYLQKNDVLIVPLLSGSGMRVKIIEAMALGKTVITTDVGIEGIDAKHLKHVLIANTAKEFIQIIKGISKNKEILKEIGENARTFVEKYYNKTIINKKLIEFYQSI